MQREIIIVNKVSQTQKSRNIACFLIDISYTHTHMTGKQEKESNGKRAGREETGKGRGGAKKREWKGLNIFKIHDTLGRNSMKKASTVYKELSL